MTNIYHKLPIFVIFFNHDEQPKTPRNILHLQWSEKSNKQSSHCKCSYLSIFLNRTDFKQLIKVVTNRRLHKSVSTDWTRFMSEMFLWTVAHHPECWRSAALRRTAQRWRPAACRSLLGCTAQDAAARPPEPASPPGRPPAPSEPAPASTTGWRPDPAPEPASESKPAKTLECEIIYAALNVNYIDIYTYLLKVYHPDCNINR